MDCPEVCFILDAGLVGHFRKIVRQYFLPKEGDQVLLADTGLSRIYNYTQVSHYKFIVSHPYPIVYLKLKANVNPNDVKMVTQFLSDNAWEKL